VGKNTNDDLVIDLLSELVANHNAAHDTTIMILLEWFEFWKDFDPAPAKMPNSLHTRTVVHLLTYAANSGDRDVVSELRKRLAL
jgi:hypothetical protein